MRLQPRGLPTLNRLITADRGDVGLRIDLVVRRHLTDVTAATRARVQRWIDEGRVSINGNTVCRVSTRTQFGDAVEIELPASTARSVPQPEDLPLEILFEDDFLLAVNKPAGVVVHPTYKHASHTMLNALLWRARSWPAGERPSIVGRLDKDTSGLVVVAKTPEMHASLQRTLANAVSEKDYLTVVYGRGIPALPFGIDLKLGRDPADRRLVVASESKGAASLTHVTRLAEAAVPEAGVSLLRCRLATGRTHQIRVHLAARGWPIVGDTAYGEPRWNQVTDAATADTLKGFGRQALHAWRLSMPHPRTGLRLTIEAPVPADMAGLIGAFFEPAAWSRGMVVERTSP